MYVVFDRLLFSAQTPVSTSFGGPLESFPPKNCPPNAPPTILPLSRLFLPSSTPQYSPHAGIPPWTLRPCMTQYWSYVGIPLRLSAQTCPQTERGKRRATHPPCLSPPFPTRRSRPALPSQAAPLSWTVVPTPAPMSGLALPAPPLPVTLRTKSGCVATPRCHWPRARGKRSLLNLLEKLICRPTWPSLLAPPASPLLP